MKTSKEGSEYPPGVRCLPVGHHWGTSVIELAVKVRIHHSRNSSQILMLILNCFLKFQNLQFKRCMMSLALFTICLISQMHGSEAVGGQCKTSERSAPGKALKGHTFKEFAVRAIVDCQNTCKRDPRCASYIFTFRAKCASLTAIPKKRNLIIL